MVAWGSGGVIGVAQQTGSATGMGSEEGNPQHGRPQRGRAEHGRAAARAKRRSA